MGCVMWLFHRVFEFSSLRVVVLLLVLCVFFLFSCSLGLLVGGLGGTLCGGILLMCLCLVCLRFVLLLVAGFLLVVVFLFSLLLIVLVLLLLLCLVAVCSLLGFLGLLLFVFVFL